MTGTVIAFVVWCLVMAWVWKAYQGTFCPDCEGWGQIEDPRYFSGHRCERCKGTGEYRPHA